MPIDVAAQNAAVDRQIPALCLKVVETKLECLKNKQAVDRVEGNGSDLLSDRVQLIQAEQERTVTLHNAIVLRGPSATEQECKRWASREIADLGATQIPQIRSKGGDATSCERAVQALHDTTAGHRGLPGYEGVGWRLRLGTRSNQVSKSRSAVVGESMH